MSAKCQSRHNASQKTLFDHLVSTLDERKRDCKAERLGSLEVNREGVFVRLVDGQIAGLGAFQDAIDVSSCLPELIKRVDANVVA
jgi:hypothetical protein